MAIDVIREIFPGAQVAWERTPRVQVPQMRVEIADSGELIHSFKQADMSDDLYGPGVDELRAALTKHKAAL